MVPGYEKELESIMNVRNITGIAVLVLVASNHLAAAPIGLLEMIGNKILKSNFYKDSFYRDRYTKQYGCTDISKIKLTSLFTRLTRKLAPRSNIVQVLCSQPKLSFRNSLKSGLSYKIGWAFNGLSNRFYRFKS